MRGGASLVRAQQELLNNCYLLLSNVKAFPAGVGKQKVLRRT